MPNAIRTLLLAVMFALGAGGASSGPIEDGAAAYIRKDYATALSLWRPVAEQGDANTQHLVGIMYESGQGVLQDYAEAAKWYRQAADQGDIGAQYSLGVLYDKGRGVVQDYVQAHKWYNLVAAVSSGPEGAKAQKDRDKIAAKMTPAQIAEAQKSAREWKPVTGAK